MEHVSGLKYSICSRASPVSPRTGAAALLTVFAYVCSKAESNVGIRLRGGVGMHQPLGHEDGVSWDGLGWGWMGWVKGGLAVYDQDVRHTW